MSPKKEDYIKNPQKRLVYHRFVSQLNEGIAISKIAKEVNIT